MYYFIVINQAYKFQESLTTIQKKKDKTKLEINNQKINLKKKLIFLEINNKKGPMTQRIHYGN